MAILTGGSSTSAGTGGGPTTGESVLGTLDGMAGSQVEVVGDTVYSPTAGLWNRLRDAAFGQASVAELTLRQQMTVLIAVNRSMLAALQIGLSAKARQVDALEMQDLLALGVSFDPTFMQ